MPLRFRDFRQALCLVMTLLSGISFCSGIYLSKFFVRRGMLWLLLSVEVTNFLRSIWSGIRKPLFSMPQSVASEAIGLFVLFPFQLIIACLLSSLPPRPNMPHPAFETLRISAVSGAILHMIYTASLVAIAMLTVPAFDADVWLRDIDSSPSPFPVSIIFAYAFPWIARRFEATRPFVQQPINEEPPSIPCLPTCPPTCAVHENRARVVQKPLDANVEQGISGEAADVAPPMLEIKQPPVLPHTLVRIPNAAERRNSIYVDLQLSN
ncbi:hypothetical protein HYPSUDRAFT_868797 [Hypholoma sublateritium FD-334 SS-4]|uniref:Transmembrane protein n=1 Tax=Hypholoma sublateritium (strain FD-334 SS-4) TaxID=945553 RepID=A0A0D2Q7M0_HYPSF|nr:hypothetical protein HYPSUDRAFT_868797 [Hypholoma sublateritium FD-334 SS-4]